jgi:hypothetical protein
VSGSGFVAPWASIIYGFISAVWSNLSVRGIKRLGYKDRLNAFGIHAVGASVGLILTGILHQHDTGDGTSLINYPLVGYQAIAVVSIATYSFIMTYLILLVMNLIREGIFEDMDEDARLSDSAMEMELGEYQGGNGILAIRVDKASEKSASPIIERQVIIQDEIDVDLADLNIVGVGNTDLRFSQCLSDIAEEQSMDVLNSASSQHPEDRGNVASLRRGDSLMIWWYNQFC